MKALRIPLFLQMALVAVVFAVVAACSAPEPDVSHYTCPMHPQIRSDGPGQCPICGMDLVPVPLEPAGEKSEGKVDADHEGHAASAPHGVMIDPRLTQTIGVVTEKALKRPLVKTVGAFGKAAHDRDLWVAQNEFIEALKLGDRKLVESTRSKLVFMGLSEEWIGELKRNREPDHELHLAGSGGSGFFEAYVSQDDATGIAIGDAVDIFNTQGREIATGTVKAVSTLVDMTSRTVRVIVKSAERVDVKLNTFVQFKIRTALGEKLSIPRRAALFNGDATLVYVAHEDGYFEARPVKLGSSAGEYEEIIQGLKEGEKVVVNGHFLIDAETQIRMGADEVHRH